MKCGLGEQTAKSIEKNRLNDYPQKVVNRGVKSSWKPVTCSVPQQWYRGSNKPPLKSRPASLQATATHPKNTSPLLLLLSRNKPVVSSDELCTGCVSCQPLTTSRLLTVGRAEWAKEEALMPCQRCSAEPKYRRIIRTVPAPNLNKAP